MSNSEDKQDQKRASKKVNSPYWFTVILSLKLVLLIKTGRIKLTPQPARDGDGHLAQKMTHMCCLDAYLEISYTHTHTHTHCFSDWDPYISTHTHLFVHCACEIAPLYCSHHHPHPTCSSRNAFCSFTLKGNFVCTHRFHCKSSALVQNRPSKRSVLICVCWMKGQQAFWQAAILMYL